MKIETSWWFAFRGQELLVPAEGPAAALEAAEWSALGLPAAAEPLHIGEIQRVACYAVGVDAGVEPPEGLTFLGLRKLWTTATKTVTLANGGPGVLDVGAITVPGVGDFWRSSTTCGSTLAAGSRSRACRPGRRCSARCSARSSSVRGPPMKGWDSGETVCRASS